MGHKHLTKEQLAEIARRFPNESNEAIAKDFGVSPWTIKSRGEKNHWHKSKEYRHILYSEVAKRCENHKRINTPEAYAKRVETMKKLIANDRLRIKWGLEQKTKRHIKLEPTPKILQRNRLERMGYIIDNARLIAYYTPKTKRAVRLEKIPRGVKKGSITSYFEFKPYEGQMD